MPIKRKEILTLPVEFESREYKIFKEEERLASLPRTLFEKACRFASRVHVQPDKETGKKLMEAIGFSHLKATPEGVASLTLLFAFAVAFPTLVLILLDTFFGISIISFGYGMMILLLEMPFVYYLYTYPMHLKKNYEMSVGSEIVSMILYVAMFMRNTPNLERAISFAAGNLAGPMALELRKIMWDVEVRNYLNIEDALLAYTKKWAHNRAFIESIEIIISSLRQPETTRNEMLSEVVNVILDGNRETAKHFSQSLNTPVMVVHAMGVILPVLGLVLFPLVAVFLGVGAVALFFVYNVVLPIVLLFVITNILESRPSTFSSIDVSENPDVPPKGKFFAGKKPVAAWPFGVLTAAAGIGIGAFFLMLEGTDGLIAPIAMMGGICMGFSVYYILATFQLTGLREKTREIENEFAEALFQLGNQINSGIPLEISLQQSVRRTQNLKIRDLFTKALGNMKSMGMTFRQAFFDKTYGAIRFYPSRVVKSVMNAVIESAEKGAKVASTTMVSISRYLRNVHATQEQINDELNEPVSSMKFQLYFLSPMISGVVVTLTIIILTILRDLSAKTAALPLGNFLPMFGEAGITTFEFVIVVAVYLIETIFILSYFINGIENGTDVIGRQNTTGVALVIGYAVFIITLALTLMIFGPLTMISVA